jgi:hypothetical protein
MLSGSELGGANLVEADLSQTGAAAPLPSFPTPTPARPR